MSESKKIRLIEIEEAEGGAHVPYPLFELAGPRCSSCSRGVLVDHLNLVTRNLFRRCSECGKEFPLVFASYPEVPKP